jgi:hypothetical protein
MIQRAREATKMNVNDYNDPIAEAADEINRLRDQLELKDQILKSVAKQGIEQKALIRELCDALECYSESWPMKETDLIQRAREATK